MWMSLFLALWSCRGYLVCITMPPLNDSGHRTSLRYQDIPSKRCMRTVLPGASTTAPSAPQLLQETAILICSEELIWCLAVFVVRVWEFPAKHVICLRHQVFSIYLPKKRVYYLAFFHGDLIQGLWTKWKWKTPFSYKTPLACTLNPDSLSHNKHRKNQGETPEKFIAVNC